LERGLPIKIILIPKTFNVGCCLLIDKKHTLYQDIPNLCSVHLGAPRVTFRTPKNHIRILRRQPGGMSALRNLHLNVLCLLCLVNISRRSGQAQCA